MDANQCGWERTRKKYGSDPFMGRGSPLESQSHTFIISVGFTR
jgi:hypothetical protein